MVLVTQPLREEHKELIPHIEALRAVADSVGEVPLVTLRQSVDDAYAFLANHLIPHAQAEERVLYPAVGALLNAPEATATMSQDHIAIGRLIDELKALRARLSAEPVGDAVLRDLRRVLYGLYTLISVHFSKEEDVYLPLLDAKLSPEEARRLFAAMSQAARAPHAQHGSKSSVPEH